MSLDEAYDLFKNEGAGVPAPVAPGASGPGVKKYPRKEKPTVQMKPITDAEAMANLKAGKHIERSLAHLQRALQTGYGKVSGGGALKAPNRGWGTVYDLERAVLAPPPHPGSADRPFLPGVHPASMKPKYGDAGRKMGMPSKKTKTKSVPTITASMRPSVSSKKTPSVLDAGGAAILASTAADQDNVVHKSGGVPTMGNKTNFNDLFKSELNPGEEPLGNCPHCEHPITKSDLEKGHGGKGKVTHLTGAKQSDKPMVAQQNPEGGVTRPGDGPRNGTVLDPSRGVPGAEKVDEVRVQSTDRAKRQNAAAMQANTPSKKIPSMSKAEDADGGDASNDEQPVKKSQFIVRGTEFVQYIEGPADVALAKAILEGSLGGTPPTQPLDLNNDMTRLLY